MSRSERKKIIILSAMHKRHEVVKYCHLKTPPIPKLMVYTDPKDGRLLNALGIESIRRPNKPLSHKWNEGVNQLRYNDFDAVILMGSDDYFDESFLQFVEDNIDSCDLIGFTDIYFEESGSSNRYYWPGYEGKRKGEPAGAGKVYSKKFLERINFDLFPESRNNSLDGMSWRVCKRAGAKIKTFSLKNEGLYLADVKDGQGLTPLKSIGGLIKIK